MRKTTMLRELLKSDTFYMAPGCHDALGAYMIEKSGFQIAYMTGYGASCSVLGRPDVAEITMTEQVRHAGRIASAVNIPLIADSDSGYGGTLNLQRAVKEFIRAGVAGIHIEDQMEPKRCVAMDGMRVVDLKTACTRIKAAVEARNELDPDFVIIARTDSNPVLGLDAAIERAKAFAEAGADMVYVELMQNEEQVEKVARELKGYPLFVDMFENPKAVLLPCSKLRELGFRICSYPMTSTLVYAKAMMKMLKGMKEGDGRGAVVDQMMSLHEFEEFIGLSGVWEYAAQLERSVEPIVENHKAGELK
ncbi:MAG: isocitrate lyase/PEP mutase family protein [Clostridium sp.]|nr:isocitrate lyase/PEP mutase family protein [Clostridium sp.]